MRTNHRGAASQARGAASPLRSGLCTLALVGALAGCGDIPGMPQDGYNKLAYRERDAIAQPAQPNPPPVVAGLGAGAAAIPTLPANAPAEVTQAMVETGAQQYATVCGACHGAGGAGTGAGPALNDADWIHISGAYPEIVSIINSGVMNPQQFPGAMPPKGGGNFNDEQVRAIAAYVFALSHQ